MKKCSSKGEFIMQEATMLPLTAWSNFYVISGSAAAALTGLMFVAITLIATTRRQGASGAIAAFSTPTVVHFGAVLLIALVLSAPWPALWMVGILLGLTGLCGGIYIIIVVRRTRQQNDYQPVLEDWLWHTIFPLISYIALIVAAIMLPGNPVPALFVIAAATVLFLFIGIHNAWDNVAYLVTELSPMNNER
jgi:chromate transport protein ChrA